MARRGVSGGRRPPFVPLKSSLAHRVVPLKSSLAHDLDSATVAPMRNHSGRSRGSGGSRRRGWRGWRAPIVPLAVNDLRIAALGAAKVRGRSPRIGAAQPRAADDLDSAIAAPKRNILRSPRAVPPTVPRAGPRPGASVRSDRSACRERPRNRPAGGRQLSRPPPVRSLGSIPARPTSVPASHAVIAPCRRGLIV